jgi:hypothetical protein
MKMIICARRAPGLSRTDFFHHLRHVHWPLVRDLPTVSRALAGYVQNHALGNDSPAAPSLPLPVATDRDSVIELYFDGEEGLQRLVSTPEYLAEVRPDEGRFNDLASNIMIKTDEDLFFTTDQPGHCKRFDFLARNGGLASADFRQKLAGQAGRSVLDPAFTARIDRCVLNWPVAVPNDGDGQGFGIGSLDCVRELWAVSMADLVEDFVNEGLAELSDPALSFTVFATGFTMIEPSLPSHLGSTNSSCGGYPAV